MKRLSTSNYTWPLVAFMVILGVVFVASKQHAAAEEYKRARQNWCAHLTSLSKQEESCAEEGPTRSDYLPWWYVLIAWPEGITTWAVIATGFMIAWQSAETRKAAEAASRTQGIDWDIATAPAKQRSQQKLLGMMQRLPGDALQLVIPLALSAAVMRWTLGALDPNKDAKRAGKRRADTLSKRLGRRILLQDLEHVRAAMRRPSGLPCHVS